MSLGNHPARGVAPLWSGLRLWVGDRDGLWPASDWAMGIGLSSWTSHLRSLTPASSSEWRTCCFAASLLGVLPLVVVLQAAPGPGALHCCSVHANPQAATIVHC